MNQAPSDACKQLNLALGDCPVFDRAHFVITDRNSEAVAVVDAWPDWPGGRLALVGPEGSGKTHLARIWAARSGATIAAGPDIDLSQLPSGPILLEDADRGVGDTVLFHLINRADTGGSLLLTGRAAPRQWPATLPDLRSRLNALLSVEIGAPDDAMLEGLLTMFFRERYITPDPELLTYLLRRMERSARAARALVKQLDETAAGSGRGITQAVAREVLGADSGSGDLFT